MLGPRYVVLGLAPARANWFRTVAQWTQACSIPVELLKCVSAEELRVRLGTNRAFSAILVDANLSSLDRDLIDAALQAGCAVIVVEDRRSRRSWSSLGASAVLVGAFDQSDLMEVLRQHAPPVPDPQVTGSNDIEAATLTARALPAGSPRQSAVVVTVCGSGGVGTSTLAMALAQGLVQVSDDPEDCLEGGTSGAADTGELAFGGRDPGRGVLLADLARRADLAVLHDVRDVVPGIQELVEAHRNGHLTAAQVRPLTFDVEQRGYHLLLGLRRACDWASIRPRAFEASFASLRATYGTLVCDTDSDFETERDGGSADVEERNVMALTALATADVVFAVGLSGVKGAHSLVRLLRDLDRAGASPDRVIPVFNRAPKSGRAKAELAGVLTQLVGFEPGGTKKARAHDRGPAAPIFVPERTLDEMAGHATRLPTAVVAPLVGSAIAVLRRSGRVTTQPGEPRPVAPGSLGHLYEDDGTALG